MQSRPHIKHSKVCFQIRQRCESKVSFLVCFINIISLMDAIKAVIFALVKFTTFMRVSSVIIKLHVSSNAFQFLLARGVGLPVEEIFTALRLPVFLRLFSAYSFLMVHSIQFPPLLVQTKVLLWWCGGFSYLALSSKSIWHKNVCFFGKKPSL